MNYKKQSYDFKNLNDLSVISKYWIKAQKRSVIMNGNFAFYKTHSANIKVNDFRYTNEDTTLGLIYLVRDPRDVAISSGTQGNNAQIASPKIWSGFQSVAREGFIPSP